MFRRFTCLLALVAIMLPAIVQAQGLLIVVDPDQQVRLPRPIIIYPPHPCPPRPIPRPTGSCWRSSPGWRWRHNRTPV